MIYQQQFERRVHRIRVRKVTSNFKIIFLYSFKVAGFDRNVTPPKRIRQLDFNLSPNSFFRRPPSPKPISPSYKLAPSKNIDPEDKCIVENCFNSRLILPNGDKMLVCSLNCEGILKGRTFY